jgi:hypothetical protein
VAISSCWLNLRLARRLNPPCHIDRVARIADVRRIGLRQPVNDGPVLRQNSEQRKMRVSLSWRERSRSHRPKFKNSRFAQFVGSPVSEQPAHHAADQAAWTAPATTAVMVNTTRATTTGRMVVIGFVAAAGTGLRR